MTDTAPTIVNRTLPRRLPNSAYRAREYLTEKEVDRLIEAAHKRGRNRSTPLNRTRQRADCKRSSPGVPSARRVRWQTLNYASAWLWLRRELQN